MAPWIVWTSPLFTWTRYSCVNTRPSVRQFRRVLPVFQIPFCWSQQCDVFTSAAVLTAATLIIKWTMPVPILMAHPITAGTELFPETRLTEQGQLAPAGPVIIKRKVGLPFFQRLHTVIYKTSTYWVCSPLPFFVSIQKTVQSQRID